MDSRDRGETLDQFLDHAALVSDADAYDEAAQITPMTLHAAKGLSSFGVPGWTGRRLVSALENILAA
jgi:superfamily I DNA/RNA helicase